MNDETGRNISHALDVLTHGLPQPQQAMYMLVFSPSHAAEASAAATRRLTTRRCHSKVHRIQTDSCRDGWNYERTYAYRLLMWNRPLQYYSCAETM